MAEMAAGVSLTVSLARQTDRPAFGADAKCRFMRRLLLRRAGERGGEADLRQIRREDRGVPAGIGNYLGLERVAAGLHFRPGTGLAQLDLVVRDRAGRQE